eukprot:2313010-Rhodomonas_salina.1
MSPGAAVESPMVAVCRDHHATMRRHLCQCHSLGSARKHDAARASNGLLLRVTHLDPAAWWCRVYCDHTGCPRGS